MVFRKRFFIILFFLVLGCNLFAADERDEIEQNVLSVCDLKSRNPDFQKEDFKNQCEYFYDRGDSEKMEALKAFGGQLGVSFDNKKSCEKILEALEKKINETDKNIFPLGPKISFEKFGALSRNSKRAGLVLLSGLNLAIQLDLSNLKLDETDLCYLNPFYRNRNGNNPGITSIILSQNPEVKTLLGLRGGFPGLISVESLGTNLFSIGFQEFGGSQDNARWSLILSHNPRLGNNICNITGERREKSIRDMAFFYKIGWTLIDVSNSGFSCLDPFFKRGQKSSDTLSFLFMDENDFPEGKPFVIPGEDRNKWGLKNLVFVSAIKTKNFPLYGDFKDKLPKLSVMDLRGATWDDPNLNIPDFLNPNCIFKNGDEAYSIVEDGVDENGKPKYRIQYTGNAQACLEAPDGRFFVFH